MLQQILSGLGAGLAFAGTSYMKKEKQKFDLSKFSTTLLIGGIAGMAAGVMDLELNGTYEFLMIAGAVPIVENLIKTVYRKVLLKWF